MHESLAPTRIDRGYRRLALGAVLVQVCVIILLLRNSYFIAEDLYLPGLLAQLPWSAETLTRSMFGHLMPGFVAVWKAVASAGTLSWPLVGVIIVAIHVALLVGTVRLFTALHGRRWWVPLAALAASLSLALLSCVVWWGAALAPGIGAVAAVWVWDSTVRYLRARSAPRLLAVLLTMVVAMSFGERQILTPVYILGFILLVGIAPLSTFRARWRVALGGWPAWTAMAVVAIAFLVVYFLGGYREDSGSTAPASAIATYMGRSLVEGYLPSVLGVLPGSSPPILGWVAVGIVGAFVVFTSLKSVRSAHAWLWLLIAYVLCQLPIAVGRVGIIGVDAAVDMVRYYPEATLLFWIAASVAVSAAPRMRDVTRQRTVIAIAAVIAVLMTAVWAWSAATISNTSAGVASKRFFSQLADPSSKLGAALESGEVRMLTVPLPDKVISEGMYPWNLSDRIYPWVRRGTEMTSLVEGSLMLNKDGSGSTPMFTTIHDVAFFSGPGCTSSDEQPVSVLQGRLTPKLVGGMVRMTVSAKDPAEIRVLSRRPDGSTWPVDNQSGPAYRIPSGVSTLVVPVAPIAADLVTLRVEFGGTVCVTAADLVRPVYR
ncbi:MAG: hypothetical protein J0I43_14350 [Microbacterium sp.]|uniref:hypothetical protein n=1 Tax=Microbacterium sp. TaxID=51671 RepID=UPI001AC0AF67|nr:hypothetical protein [Microbacterium sp.]MBN9178530.1 hypothetical protein [Microbacterium sp.]